MGGGADKSVLLNLYRSLIRSKLDYGCIVYGSARQSYLKMLNTIHHQGLRLALGAFRTSPVESLYVEAGELPLEERRIKLSLQYITKLKSTPSNPAYKCVFEPEFVQKYLRGEVILLFNVTIYDISVIYVTAHRCAGGLKKKLNIRSGSQRHKHFAGFFNVPVQTPTRDHPFYTVIPTHRPI